MNILHLTWRVSDRGAFQVNGSKMFFCNIVMANSKIVCRVTDKTKEGVILLAKTIVSYHNDFIQQ